MCKYKETHAEAEISGKKCNVVFGEWLNESNNPMKYYECIKKKRLCIPIDRRHCHDRMLREKTSQMLRGVLLVLVLQEADTKMD